MGSDAGLVVVARGRLASGGVGVITDATAYVEVSGQFTITQAGNLTAVPGSTIHMTGANFVNNGTDPGKVPGLNDLAMVFEGGPANLD